MLGRNGALQREFGPEVRQVTLRVPAAHKMPEFTGLVAVAAFKVVLFRRHAGGRFELRFGNRHGVLSFPFVTQ